MKLVFVYNAKAGNLAGLIDSIHKTVSPSTYACDLCAITYGLVGMDKEWRAWLKGLGMETVFFHRQDFKESWPHVKEPLPAIFIERDGALETLVSALEFKGVPQVNDLIALMETKLELVNA